MVHKREIILGTALLAGVAGMVNLISVQATSHATVSYMTGNITQMSLALSEENITAALPFIRVLLAFFVGSILSGVIVGSEQLKFGRRYGLAFIIEGGLLISGLIAFYHHSFIGGLFAASACGLQNSMVATYSGNVIRTTHMTGVLSDIGSILGNFISRRKVQWANFGLLSAILGGYILGVITGIILYQIHGVNAILYPAILLITSGVSYMIFRIMTIHRYEVE